MRGGIESELTNLCFPSSSWSLRPFQICSSLDVIASPCGRLSFVHQIVMKVSDRLVRYMLKVKLAPKTFALPGF